MVGRDSPLFYHVVTLPCRYPGRDNGIKHLTSKNGRYVRVRVGCCRFVEEESKARLLTMHLTIMILARLLLTLEPDLAKQEPK